ncbi:MAG: PfkB family carbohydrate kinase [Acidobacteriota bacterium]|nr:PfkB family carbohydrate kinase [Blastocatellia bacterium]MDW8239437.1 PfkB family carbohydrate kinase [Acidobacteriota bacterium]
MAFGLPLPQHRPFDVVGLGLNAMDYLITVPYYPAFNSKVEFLNYAVKPGGQVATAMAALARLGARVRYIGAVGSDDVGQKQIASLVEAGVECSRVRVVDQASSQLAFIIIDQRTGERTIIWSRDARLAIQPDHLDHEAITAGRILHLDGHDVAAGVQAARWARQAGMPVVIDVDNAYPGIEELLPLVDYLVTSADFPQRVTGLTDHREGLKALKERFGNYFVAMTLGADGALAYHQGQYVHVPGFQVECRDTTGAGDAFHGGFIYGLLQGMSLIETLRFANAVAALNCRELGARGGLPTLEEVEALLRAQ